MLVPAMASTGTRFSSSTLSTPMCAAPRAPPPESTSPIRGREGSLWGAASCAGVPGEINREIAANNAAFPAFLFIGTVARIVVRGDNRPPDMRMSPISAALMLPLASAAGEPPAGGTLASTTAEDIVVTAARQERSAATTPASISHMDSAALADISAKHQADSMNRNAGVYVQRGSGAESLMGIRSPVLTGAGACGSFLVAEDSLPIRPVGFCNLNEMFELNYEQAGALEILRGPGSAMFGASAVHGVVNTRTPDVDSLPPWGIGFETGSNSFKRLRLSGASDFGGPVSFGAYGVATRAPGWRDESGVDEAKLNLLADTTLPNGGELRFRAAGSVLNQETAGFIQGYNSYEDPDIARSNPNPEAFRDASSARVAVHYGQEGVFGEADELRLAGIYRRSSMDFIQHFLIGKPFEHNEQTSFMLSAIESIPLGKLTLRVML